jgi:hypothetical protein
MNGDGFAEHTSTIPDGISTNHSASSVRDSSSEAISTDPLAAHQAKPSSDGEHRRIVRGIDPLILALAVLCAFWAVIAYFVEFDVCAFLILASLLAAWPLFVGLLILRWGGFTGERLVFSVLSVPASLVGLFILFQMEMAVLGVLLRLCPPPRPMFCNDFVAGGETLLPRWRIPLPVHDSFGHLGWPDLHDNLLLVVANGVPGVSRERLDSTSSQCRVQVGDDRGNLFVTLDRTRDTLVVILPDGSVGRFTLAPGRAEQFRTARRAQQIRNVLRQAGELLDPADKQEFDRFLADYREPLPQKD